MKKIKMYLYVINPYPAELFGPLYRAFEYSHNGTGLTQSQAAAWVRRQFRTFIVNIYEINTHTCTIK